MKKRFRVEGQPSTMGMLWQIWDGEQRFARFRNIADLIDAEKLCAALEQLHCTVEESRMSVVAKREAVLEEALRPFAREAQQISDAPDLMNKSWAGTGLSYGDWHRAAAALTTPAPAEPVSGDTVSTDEIVAALEGIVNDPFIEKLGSWRLRARSTLSRLRGEGK